jgi:hypothetical protein
MTKSKKPTEETSEKPPSTTGTAYVKKLLPTHWAREEGIDESLFLAWNNDAITHDEWTALKRVVSKKLR